MYLLTRQLICQLLAASCGQYISPKLWKIRDFSCCNLPLAYPYCSAYSVVAEWKLLINPALPSNGIMRAEPWKWVSSYI